MRCCVRDVRNHSRSFFILSTITIDSSSSSFKTPRPLIIHPACCADTAGTNGMLSRREKPFGLLLVLISKECEAEVKFAGDVAVDRSELVAAKGVEHERKLAGCDVVGEREKEEDRGRNCWSGATAMEGEGFDVRKKPSSPPTCCC